MNLNILLIAAAIVLLLNIAIGAKNGMIKSVVSLITSVITFIMILLIVSGFNFRAKGQIMNTIVVILLLGVIGIVQLLLKPLFFSAKMIVKLPVISWVDKLFGIAFGALETVFLLWTMYCIMRITNLGSVREQILQYTQDSQILTWFYEHNYLALFLQKVSQNMDLLPKGFS